MIDGANVLLTGGTGSFGRMFTQVALQRGRPKRLVVFSRDELKQHEMREALGSERYPNIRYFIGDVRDRDRLYRALDGIDVVVHAAALKQVPTAEYNPLEFVKTNVLGAANLIDACIDRGVKRVIALSTDKAANPINLYGATKLCSDKLFVAANSYSGHHGTKFSVVRYGNVLGSRGSVLPLFLKLRKTGVLPITDDRMTRFWITLEQGVEFVLRCLKYMHGGEIFVPKIASMLTADLARAVGEGCKLKTIGIRAGEKLHEVLVTEDDARHTIEHEDYFAIVPEFPEWDREAYKSHNGGRPCAEGFRYSSETNPQRLSVADLRAMVLALETQRAGE
jgi:UDP-N-acetylglucosamine 4,6-dehydratase